MGFGIEEFLGIEMYKGVDGTCQQAHYEDGLQKREAVESRRSNKLKQ